MRLLEVHFDNPCSNLLKVERKLVKMDKFLLKMKRQKWVTVISSPDEVHSNILPRVQFLTFAKQTIITLCTRLVLLDETFQQI